MSLIKGWFANIDTSYTNWRVSWSLIILPLLLFALVFLLMRTTQLSTEQAGAAVQLQKLVQSEEPRSVSAADLQRTLEKKFASLEAQTRKLQQWLEKGRSTQASAKQAAALAEMVSAQQGNETNFADDKFWNSFSDKLAVLHTSAEHGEIKTSEASDLINRLQTQSAEIRIAATSQPASIEEQTNVVQSSQTQSMQSVDFVLDEWTERRLQINRLRNRALILAFLSTLTFFVLLWGLWRGARQRHLAMEGRHRGEQDAIVRLLDEITPLSQGDLRVRATVGEASTGAVADAFNYAVDELRRLVRAVTDSAGHVNSSVNATRDSAYHLARASSVQAREVHRSSNHLNVMSDTMAQLSAHAVESSRIADISVQHARTGNQAVQSNADSLLRIRDQADMTSRLMQRLVETSGAINERVRDIQEVAKRTDLLALNATIRSSAQVSIGGAEDVSMLSDDIAHLSDTLSRATREITNLSDLVQQDAIITLKSMEKTVYELDDGQRTAVLASEALTEIDRVSIKLNGLISDIAAKSLRQAGVVKRLSSNMTVINNITSDSARQLQESANALESLQKITSELSDSVSDFKLPYDAAGSMRKQFNRSTQAKSLGVNSKIARRTVKHA